MKRVFVLAAVLSSLVCNAWAEGATCAAQSADKKLVGAAKTSFMKKCQADATNACNSTAADKKLVGAAKSSFVKKCVADAAG
ncbi:MAG TPA: hypothetical protein VE690_19180 [Rhodopila sp.]|nr:hypothetical protein [Rhodopila sp.]